MDLEDELRRVLRDDKLDVAVRTGAEWSLVAGSRRRRHQRNTMAAVGGFVAATFLVGGSVALISHDSTGQVPPAVAPVATTSSKLSKPHRTEPPSNPSPGQPNEVPNDLEPSRRDPSGQEMSSSQRPSVLRESETSKPEPTESTPPVTTSPQEPTSSAPSSSAVGEPGG